MFRKMIGLVGAAALFSMANVGMAATHPVPGIGTPDTSPPAEEGVCDALGGRLWGLCVAYCEAQDCDSDANFGKNSCRVLRGKLVELLGPNANFPCEEPN